MSRSKRKEEPLPAPLQLFVFDERRGEKEGQELEKVLACYPSHLPEDAQASVVGLAQAALAFTSNFRPDQPCSVLNTEHKQWLLQSPEPHIYLLMVVERSWHKGPVSEGGLQSILKQLYQLLTLLHGPFEGLLEQDASGKAGREGMQGVLKEFGSRLDKQRGAEYSRLHNPLADVEAVPLLRLPQSLFLGMQSLVNQIMASPAWCGAPVLGVMLLHETWLLWTTLSMGDTNTLYHLFTWTLLPAIKAASQSSLGRRLARSSSLSPCSRVSLLQRNAWELGKDGFLVISAPVCDKKSSDEPDDALATPRLWLQSAQEWVNLMILQVMDEILLVALPEASPVASSVAEGLASDAVPGMKVESGQVARHLQATRRDHIPSFRYLFTDSALQTCKASPGSKVATLSKGSLSLTNSVRADFEAGLADDEEETAEVAVWGQQDCWVVAKGSDKRQLYTVLEQHNKEGLTDACKAADKFAQLHFEGLLQ